MATIFITVSKKTWFFSYPAVS